MFVLVLWGVTDVNRTWIRSSLFTLAVNSIFSRYMYIKKSKSNSFLNLAHLAVVYVCVILPILLICQETFFYFDFVERYCNFSDSVKPASGRNVECTSQEKMSILQAYILILIFKIIVQEKCAI